MRTLAFALAAVTGCLLVAESAASAMPANGTAIIHAAQQTNSVIAVRKRCPPGQARDRYGYCVPSARGF
jgi:hypothetical protein